MSVLVALYEGSNGRSNIELKEALQFPTERDIIRVGVRDIHRRLRVSAATNQPSTFLAWRYINLSVFESLRLHFP